MLGHKAAPSHFKHVLALPHHWVFHVQVVSHRHELAGHQLTALLFVLDHLFHERNSALHLVSRCLDVTSYGTERLQGR